MSDEAPKEAEEWECPIPTTHRRLHDSHRLWHQTLAAYDDPGGFRANLNSAIQAFRSVTLMLQKEKRQVPGFDEWYPGWQERMRDDEVLRWLNAARTRIFHEGDLETFSSARVRIRDEWAPAKVLADDEVPPLWTTEEVASNLGKGFAEQFSTQVGADVPEHFLLSVERRWVDRDLEEWELLDALSHAYGVMAEILKEAHERCGAKYETWSVLGHEPESLDVSHLGGRLPCMVATAEERTVLVKLATGEMIRPVVRKIERDLLDAEFGQRAVEKYRLYEFEPPTTVDAFAWGDFYVQMAKRILLVDKYHIPVTFLFGPNGKESIVHPAADRAEKFANWDRIAGEVERFGATALIAIAEAWLYRLPGSELEASILRPQRGEGLQIVIAASDGRCRSVTIPFRRRLGRIIPEPVEDIELDAPPNFLKAVVAVWERQAASPPPEDDSS